MGQDSSAHIRLIQSVRGDVMGQIEIPQAVSHPDLASPGQRDISWATGSCSSMQSSSGFSCSTSTLQAKSGENCPSCGAPPERNGCSYCGRGRLIRDKDPRSFEKKIKRTFTLPHIYPFT